MAARSNKNKSGGAPDRSTAANSNQRENPLVALNASRTPSERSAAASVAGIASGKARRAKGDLVGRLRAALEDNPDQIVNILLQIMKDDSRPALQLKASELVFKVAGLMAEQSTVTIRQDQPFVTLDLSSMSDEELRRYADQQIVEEDN